MMPFSVRRLQNEPIVIVTITNPTATIDAAQITRTVMKYTADIEGRVYRITDYSAATLQRAIIHRNLARDINFTGLNVRSVVVGEGAMIDYLVRYANENYICRPKIACFEDLEDALKQLRWEINSQLEV